MDARYINCDDECSEDNAGDHEETYRWFHYVLPQLRNLPIYGSRPLEFVQGPGEAIYLPHGLGHSVLNVRDNVAVTENFLFVDALPELMSKVALDEISMFRPNWDERGIKKLYYDSVNGADRSAMRAMYEQAIKRIDQSFGHLCDEAEK